MRVISVAVLSLLFVSSTASGQSLVLQMVFGVQGNEGVLAFAPVRAGIAWRF